MPINIKPVDFPSLQACDSCRSEENVLLIECTATWKSIHLCPSCRLSLLGLLRQDSQSYVKTREKESSKYTVAGKLGPWARYGCRGERYLMVGSKEKGHYALIKHVEKSGDTWRYIDVLVEGSSEPHAHGCGTNTYRKA